MLKNFLYLNEASLDAYLSALEGGLRSAVEQRTATSTGVAGGVDARILSGKADRSREDATTVSIADTPHARFERLEGLASGDVEASGWVSVLSPENDLEGIGIGALIDIECDVYVPDVIKALSSSGGMVDALNTIEALMPLANVLGLDTSGMPDAGQSAAMKAVVHNLGSDQVLVGERDDSEWRVAGKLQGPYLRSDIDGTARVVGKVSAAWKMGQWKPLLSLPGMNLMPREQRRKMEREGPGPDQAEQWLEGPALMLDVLAVYR